MSAFLIQYMERTRYDEDEIWMLSELLETDFRIDSKRDIIS